mgnify:CR=1 FL=1
MKNKVILVAPAIKIQFWKEFYKNVIQNDCDIEIIFVGHREPNFNLPANFHYIYSKERPTLCAEIAYNKAYELGGDYIQNTADDCLYSANHFDKLISAIKKEEEKYSKDELIMVGPASYNGDQLNIMALFPDRDHWDKDSRGGACRRAGGTEEDLGCDGEGPTLPTGNFSSIETSKKLGGIDTRYHALYWDCDQAMICHSMGGKVLIYPKEIVPPVIERKKSNSTLWGRFGRQDYNLLTSLWDVRSHDGETWTVKRKIQ